MTKDELKIKIADLRATVFQPDQPVDVKLYRELKDAQDKLSAIEQKERNDDFYQRYSVEVAERKKNDVVLKETTKHEIYRSF